MRHWHRSRHVNQWVDQREQKEAHNWPWHRPRHWPWHWSLTPTLTPTPDTDPWHQPLTPIPDTNPWHWPNNDPWHRPDTDSWHRLRALVMHGLLNIWCQESCIFTGKGMWLDLCLWDLLILKKKGYFSGLRSSVKSANMSSAFSSSLWEKWSSISKVNY